MTLSHRHKLSTKKIYAIYGKSLKGYYGNISTSFSFRKNWSLKKRRWQSNKEFIDPFSIF